MPESKENKSDTSSILEQIIQAQETATVNEIAVTNEIQENEISTTNPNSVIPPEIIQTNKKMKLDLLNKHNYEEQQNKEDISKNKEEDLKKKKKTNNEELKKVNSLTITSQETEKNDAMVTSATASKDVVLALNNNDVTGLTLAQAIITNQQSGIVEEVATVNQVGNNNTDGQDSKLILHVQTCLATTVNTVIANTGVSPNEVRRRRRRREQAFPAQSEVASEGEVEEVGYEPIKAETVPRKMSRTWRNVPKYRLTKAEASQQEADLFFNFLYENKHEGVEPIGPEDKQCCVCYENKATRIIIPCGHQCLCYNCARAIALNRTTLANGRIAKKCPLCQAAIANMIRPL